MSIAAETDLLNFRADAQMDLAAVLESASRSVEASVALADALRFYELKGNPVGAESVRAHLDALSAV